jgi:hypothetical protein
MTQSATITQEPQQRMRALERANEVRLKRAELKRKIADGHLSAADVILDLPDAARNWSVGELLKSQRRWGSIRSHKLLTGMHISEKRPIGDLTERQRLLIAERLAVHAAQRPAAQERHSPRVLGAPAAEVREVLHAEAPLAAPDVDLHEPRELQLVGA